MIDVDSLTRHYGKTAAVEDVTFNIGDNDIVGLLGHNGAGKTTVMRMLSGYLEPSAGSIIIQVIHGGQRMAGTGRCYLTISLYRVISQLTKDQVIAGITRQEIIAIVGIAGSIRVIE